MCIVEVFSFQKYLFIYFRDFISRQFNILTFRALMKETYKDGVCSLFLYGLFCIIINYAPAVK